MKSSVSGIHGNSQSPIRCYESCLLTCYIGNDVFSVICCNVSIFVAVETWLPGRCLAMDTWLRLHYCGVQASYYNTVTFWERWLGLVNHKLWKVIIKISSNCYESFFFVKATGKRMMMRYEIIMSDIFQVADLCITRSPRTGLYILYPCIYECWCYCYTGGVLHRRTGVISTSPNFVLTCNNWYWHSR
jgi:hypothetical protein